ncbi:MAG: ATP-binding protein, partial [Bacteroidia bacterium]
YFDKPFALKSLIKFCHTNELQSPIVTTINKEGAISAGSLDIQFFPAASYAYTVGRNTLQRKINE